MSISIHTSKPLPQANERRLGRIGLLLPSLSGKQNTTYEQLTCVGYHPELEELYAVISLKQPSGYQGGLCSAGTIEYVRFYMSFDDRQTWQDMGVTTAPAHDLATAAPVSAAVTLRIDAPAFPCSDEAANIVHVRAILSWSVEPPPATPGYAPAWGNVVDAAVQLDPLPSLVVPKLPAVKLAVSKPPKLSLDPLPIKVKAASAARPVAVSPRPRELLAQYLRAGVPAHRAVAPFLDAHQTSAKAILPGSVIDALGAAKIDLADLAKDLVAQSGDTSFEELTCVGLDPLRRQLVGVVHVKRPSGFSGSLCQAGSKEHVAFWVDWGTGSWAYQGTADVTVHDIAGIGDAGLRYAVSLPLSLREHARTCGEGANVVKVRAVLSWQAAPSTSDPDHLPFWGNRREASVLVPPAAKVQPGLFGQLQAAGRIALDDIGPDGFTRSTSTKPTVVTVSGPGMSYREAPFGGAITLHGEIFATTPGARYRFHLRELNAATKTPLGAFTPLLANFPNATTVNQKIGTTTTPVPLQCDADGWYQPIPNVWEDILAIWYTNASQSGKLYELCLEVEGEAVAVENRPACRIFIDNSSPTASLTLPTSVNGHCTDTEQGSAVTGVLTARADYFEGFGFQVLPPVQSQFQPSDMTVKSPAAVGGVVEWQNWDYPDIKVQEGLPQGVDGGTFSLATAKMDPCGYSLTLTVWSRTNVNSGYKRATHDYAGFCVKAKGSP